MDKEKIKKRKISTRGFGKEIIRNELKIKAAITNAQKFLEIQKEFGSFDKFIWGFVNYKPIRNKIAGYVARLKRAELTPRKIRQKPTEEEMTSRDNY